MYKSTRHVDRFVRKAIRWIVLNLDGFDPFKRNEAYDIRDGQRLGELAILLRAYASITGRLHSEEARKIQQRLYSIQQRQDFSDRLLRSPEELVLFVEIYASLKAVGDEPEYSRELIQRVIDAGYPAFTERLPHRVMDLVSCLERGGFQHSLPSLSRLRDVSILARVPCPIVLNEDALYFFTHVIMFLYDFGSQRRPVLSQRFIYRLRPALSSLVVAMCQERHWDLLAEMLLCWDCVGLPHDQFYVKGWNELLNTQDHNGAVPGPEWALQLYQKVKREPDKPLDAESYFAHHYHTTLVSVIAGSLYLQQEGKLMRLTSKSELPESGNQRRAKPPSLLRHNFNGNHVRQSLRLSYGWLIGLIADQQFRLRAPLSAICSILTGLWMCESSNRQCSPQLRAIVHETGQMLALQDAQTPLDWTSTPATLRMIAAAIWRYARIEIPSLHGSQGFVRQAANVLCDDFPQGDDDDIALSEKRALLFCMGLHPRPYALPRDVLSRAFRDFSLSAPRNQIENLVLQVKAHTLHGLRTLPASADYAQMGSILCALTVSHLRNLDFMQGCNLLRAAAYLDYTDVNRMTCLDWLLLQQRPSGEFGFFESISIQNAKGTDALTALHLPLTLECLWTLAESRYNWRLFGSLPPW